MTEQEENRTAAEKEEYTKPTWLETRHAWYDNLNVTVKQLDIIIAVALAALAVVFVLIALEATGVIVR